jgi:hypothetical protein
MEWMSVTVEPRVLRTLSRARRTGGQHIHLLSSPPLVSICYHNSNTHLPVDTLIPIHFQEVMSYRLVARHFTAPKSFP